MIVEKGCCFWRVIEYFAYNLKNSVHLVHPFLLVSLLLLSVAQTHGKSILPTPKKEFEKLVHPNFIKTIKKYNLIVDDLRRLYFNDDDLTEENFGNLIDLEGDMHFIEGIHKVVKIQVEKSNSSTYLYKFSFDKEVSAFKKMTKTNLKGKNFLYIILLR